MPECRLVFQSQGLVGWLSRVFIIVNTGEQKLLATSFELITTLIKQLWFVYSLWEEALENQQVKWNQLKNESLRWNSSYYDGKENFYFQGSIKRKKQNWTQSKLCCACEVHWFHIKNYQILSSSGRVNNGFNFILMQ